MVDSVKNAVSRIETAKPKNHKVDSNAPVNKIVNSSSVTEGDNVKLKSAETAENTKVMASSAPMDLAKITRIKEAIRDGKYPIDIDKISDALMDAYRELKS